MEFAGCLVGTIVNKLRVAAFESHARESERRFHVPTSNGLERFEVSRWEK